MYKKTVLILLALWFIAGVAPAYAQASQASIKLLDRKGQGISSIVDGNTVQLSIKLTTPVNADAKAAFFLDGIEKPVATCSLTSGQDSCLSAPFYALGWYWNADGSQHPGRTVSVQIDGQAAAGGILQVNVKPRPVVMVHGFISSWEIWQHYLGADGYLASIGLQGFAVGDGQVPGLLNTGHINDPRKRTNTIAQNAEILGQYIAAVQQKTGAEKVDLLVHSMGGMISRYYLDRIMSTDNVTQVIFLGTPMSGSSCIFPLAALGFMSPASLEIQPSYMINVFNKQIIHRQGVGFHMLAGTFLTDPLTSPCSNAPSDTVVALDSANAIPLDDFEQFPLFHDHLATDAGTFQNGVRKFLQAIPGSFEPRPDPLDPLTPPDAPEQFSRAYTGHLAPGQTANITINIDPNVTLANFNMYDSSRSLEIAVRGANGNIIQLDAQKNGMLKVDDPNSMVYLGYGFPQPNPGAWQIELKTTGNTPAQGADYAVNARFLGGIRLEASTDQTIFGLGQSVTLNASLQGDGVSAQIDSAVALIHKPDGTSESLPLAANGDQYSLTYQPQENGLYSVELNVTGKATDGTVIDRAANLSFQAEFGGAQGKKPSFPWVMPVALGMFIVALLIVIMMKIYLRKR